MSDQDDIPVLNDLIEKGAEITLSDLGLDDDTALRVADVEAELALTTDDTVAAEEIDLVADDPFADTPFTDGPFTDGPFGDDPLFSAEVSQAAPLSGNPFVPASLAADPPAMPAHAADALADNPALEQAVRRILDEHMELAWHEIRLAIQQHLDR